MTVGGWMRDGDYRRLEIDNHRHRGFHSRAVQVFDIDQLASGLNRRPVAMPPDADFNWDARRSARVARSTLSTGSRRGRGQAAWGSGFYSDTQCLH